MRIVLCLPQSATEHIPDCHVSLTQSVKSPQGGSFVPADTVLPRFLMTDDFVWCWSYITLTWTTLLGKYKKKKKELCFFFIFILCSSSLRSHCSSFSYRAASLEPQYWFWIRFPGVKKWPSSHFEQPQNYTQEDRCIMYQGFDGHLNP